MIIYIPRGMTETKHKTMQYDILCREEVLKPCTVQGSLYLFPCGDLGMCDPFCLLCCQSVALFVCLSVLGIVFPPNAALYWLCEFLNRNWPNSLQEFRSLLQIMGQFGEIYWAHICPPTSEIYPRPKLSSVYLLIKTHRWPWKVFVKQEIQNGNQTDRDKIGV